MNNKIHFHQDPTNKGIQIVLKNGKPKGRIRKQTDVTGINVRYHYTSNTGKCLRVSDSLADIKEKVKSLLGG